MDPEDPLEELLFHDEEEGAADREARHILYGCTSSDDTLSAEWARGDVRLLLPQHKQARLVLPQQYRRSGARRPAGSKNKDTPADFKVFEVNVTLTGGSCDIDPALLDVMETFLKEHCPAGMFALERGGTVSHLHLQVRLPMWTSSRVSYGLVLIGRSDISMNICRVLRMRAKTVRGITLALKRHVAWDATGKQPPGSRVMCKGITGSRLHTWAGLV